VLRDDWQFGLPRFNFYVFLHLVLNYGQFICVRLVFFFLIYFMFFEYFLLVVINGAVSCLERYFSKMTCYVSSGTLTL